MLNVVKYLIAKGLSGFSGGLRPGIRFLFDSHDAGLVENYDLLSTMNKEDVELVVGNDWEAKSKAVLLNYIIRDGMVTVSMMDAEYILSHVIDSVTYDDRFEEFFFLFEFGYTAKDALSML